MPVWWGKKSSKLKEDNHHHSHHSDRLFNSPKKPKSFDEVLGRVSPRLSRDFAGGGAGGSSSATAFSGFESEGKCHPLPRPTTTMTTGGAGSGEHGVTLGSTNGSGSVSSVSSTGSSEEQLAGQDHGGGVLRPQTTDAKLPLRSKSPGPGSRGPTSPTSPLNQLEDCRSQCHRLPLPPGSPTSPPTLPGPRAGQPGENSKWKKGKLLGRGSFGHVYLGFNSEGGQMCAIKEVRLVSDDHTSRESLKQLHQEINLLSQLSHPNIVRYFGSELADDSLSVYLEFVSGGSIHKLLQEYGAFKEPVIQNYTRQILSGLAYLHGRKTVHRDIKGANILVDPNGEIKLADFGMAKHITNCSSMLSFKGSPYWMAPEVVMNTNGYSLAVDIWSLGCTVLEMATSKPPWSQYEGVAAIFKIGNSKDIPVIPDYLSNDAKSFVSLCLKRDPSARPTAAQLLDHRFIRDQTTPRTPNKEPFHFDGSRTPPILEYVVTPPSRSIRNSRENTRTIAASMPVSPCSSPLRQFRGSAQQPRSYLLSPPHPNFAPVCQQNSAYATNIGPSRSCHTNSSPYTIDSFFRESPLLKAHTAPPGGSPRTRLI